MEGTRVVVFESKMFPAEAPVDEPSSNPPGEELIHILIEKLTERGAIAQDYPVAENGGWTLFIKFAERRFLLSLDSIGINRSPAKFIWAIQIELYNGLLARLFLHKYKCLAQEELQLKDVLMEIMSEASIFSKVTWMTTKKFEEKEFENVF